MLPPAFLLKMERLLGAELKPFLASYADERLHGLRVNPLKLAAAQLAGLGGFRLEPVPWCRAGFYYDEQDRPGKHPLYHAGLYYIQEPSAMAPVELLDARPGDRVLDLCAAPGGKSTQIAGKLAGSGVLVVNDIHSDRVKALVKNLELAGVRNAVVLNEDPEKLQETFGGWFDKILLDAPCSGEGMFRKEESMAKAWQPDWPEKYAAMQRSLLRQAERMLKPGGRLVYSTCTFSPEENEAMIAAFLEAHPHMEAVDPSEWVYPEGRVDWEPGRPEWAGSSLAGAMETAHTARLWPHRLRGEGHYVAVLRKRETAAAQEDHRFDEDSADARAVAEERSGKQLSRERLQRKDRIRLHGGSQRGRGAANFTASDGDVVGSFRQFADDHLDIPAEALMAVPVVRAEHLYAAPASLPELSGIRVIRPGWYLGSAHKRRWQPSHALALGLRDTEALRRIRFRADDEGVIRYLKGETLTLPEEALQVSGKQTPRKGYCLVCIDNYPLGWGKWQDGLLKNEYPSGWRWT